MHRLLVIGGLTVALALTGCDEPKRTSRKTRAAHPANVTPVATASAPVAAPGRPVAAGPTPAPAITGPQAAAPQAASPASEPPPRAAPALALAGAGGAAAPGMAVLLLMLPAADLTRPGAVASATGAGRTYKVSLSANADLATIEIDGHPPTTTAVQRVYPTAEPARRGNGAVVRPTVAGAGPAPTRSRPMPGAATLDARDAPLSLRESLALPEPRVRSSRRPATVMTSRAAASPFFDPILYASPNGAPIIE